MPFSTQLMMLRLLHTRVHVLSHGTQEVQSQIATPWPFPSTPHPPPHPPKPTTEHTLRNWVMCVASSAVGHPHLPSARSCSKDSPGGGKEREVRPAASSGHDSLMPACVWDLTETRNARWMYENNNKNNNQRGAILGVHKRRIRPISLKKPLPRVWKLCTGSFKMLMMKWGRGRKLSTRRNTHQRRILSRSPATTCLPAQWPGCAREVQPAAEHAY